MFGGLHVWGDDMFGCWHVFVLACLGVGMFGCWLVCVRVIQSGLPHYCEDLQ